jgi:hypothetical protein
MFVKDGLGKYHKIKAFFYPYQGNRFLKLAICNCGKKMSALNHMEVLENEEELCDDC